MRKLTCSLFVLVLIVALILTSAGTAQAQGGAVDRVDINQLIATGWPRVTLRATAVDTDRAVLPPELLSLQVFEDGELVPADSVAVNSEDTGIAVVILLDLSASMSDPGVTAGTRFAEAQQAALEFVNNSLRDGDLVGVVGFATDIYDGNSIDLTSDRARATSLVQQMAPETDPDRYNTALWEAAFTAMRMFDEHPDAAIRDRLKGMRRAVVAFTDGNDTVSGGSRPGDLREWANRLGVSIYTVGLKSPTGASLRFPGPQDEDARWLADQTFGSFFDYGDVAQRAAFPEFLNRLADQRNQMRISYTSDAHSGSHETRVVVSSGDVSKEATAAWSGGGSSLIPAVIEPVPGSSFGCAAQSVKVPIVVDAQNPDGYSHIVDHVEFYDNDKLIGTVNSSPYTLDWDVNLAGSGQHLLNALLHDATLDEVVETPSVAVQVAAPARAEIQLKEPPAGTMVVKTPDAALRLEASVGFPDGCRRPVTVRFRGNGEVLAEQSSPPFVYQWDVSALAEGQHAVSVELVDSVDNRLVTANPVAFTMKLTTVELAKKLLMENWPALVLAVALLFLLLLLLRTRRQVGKAVGGAVARVRQTMMGQPTGKALATLEGVRGPAQGRSFRLTERINTVGRDPQQCEVVIADDNYVSSKHLRIEISDQGGAVLTDLNSRHGTVVNGQPVDPSQPVTLRGGERIRLGESELEFSLSSRRTTRVVRRD
ncbi:MAG: FHA domain-containing protein [Anaerolineae bacterium]|nr:FHA domain-containing protein [Anaerolineae bacterium]